MTSRCTRCHGAGGSIKKDPDQTPIAAPGGTKTTTPLGDFTTMAGSAGACALIAPFVIPDANGNLVGMPPPPSDRLDDWSTQLLVRWCKDQQP